MKIDFLKYYTHENGECVETIFDCDYNDVKRICKKWNRLYPYGECIVKYENGSEKNLTIC